MGLTESSVESCCVLPPQVGNRINTMRKSTWALRQALDGSGYSANWLVLPGRQQRNTTSASETNAPSVILEETRFAVVN